MSDLWLKVVQQVGIPATFAAALLVMLGYGGNMLLRSHQGLVEKTELALERLEMAEDRQAEALEKLADNQERILERLRK